MKKFFLFSAMGFSSHISFGQEMSEFSEIIESLSFLNEYSIEHIYWILSIAIPILFAIIGAFIVGGPEEFQSTFLRKNVQKRHTYRSTTGGYELGRNEYGGISLRPEVEYHSYNTTEYVKDDSVPGFIYYLFYGTIPSLISIGIWGLLYCLIITGEIVYAFSIGINGSVLFFCIAVLLVLFLNWVILKIFRIIANFLYPITNAIAFFAMLPAYVDMIYRFVMYLYHMQL